MRNLLKILIGIASLLLFADMTCDDNAPTYDLVSIVNNSNRTISATITDNFPDTTLITIDELRGGYAEPGNTSNITSV